MNRIVITALMASLLSACASAPSTETAASATATTAKNTSANSASVQPKQVQQSTLPPYKDPENPLSKNRSVYFEFDQYLVTKEFQPIVEAHAKYLSNNRNQKIRIEGNADEQGSREYNLALGQKRAHAVKQVMSLMGVQESQMEAISFGEEKPKAAGHNESAWAQNRRADIKYGDEK